MKLAVPMLAVSTLLTAVAAAQPTAFTYQGRLKNGAQLAAGAHDLRFRLFDASSGGTQLGTTQCADNVPVTEGLFTAQIDFGQQYATTAPRFLEIEVRADTGLDCTNATGFAPLSPRQLLTAAPMASHARAAFALDAADGSPASAVFVDNSGNVGVGTSTPITKLHVDSGDLYLGLPTDGWFFHTRFPFGGDFLHITDTVGGAPQFQRGLVLNKSGNVGIGAATPLAKLDVRGDIRLGPNGQFRAAAGEENLRVLRGSIFHTGAITAGSGFTISPNGDGVYVINFTTPFAAPPSVTAALSGNSTDMNIEVTSTTSTSATIITWIIALGIRDEREHAFHFIAVGPR